MASTNKTTNYNLSQYVGTDKPTYLGDYNSDMSKIDAQMKANNDAIAINTSQLEVTTETANSALQDAQSAQSTANSATATATSALEKATTNENEIIKLKNISAGTYGVGENFVITIGGNNIIPITSTYNSIGDKLSLQNGSIKIGSGVSKVKISCNILARVQAGNNVAKNIAILKNDAEAIVSLNTFSSNYQSNYRLNLTPSIIDVNENDLLKLRYYGAVNDTVFAGSTVTYITVEVIA